jgi:Heterokaryon incompatibility protein (HET)
MLAYRKCQQAPCLTIGPASTRAAGTRSLDELPALVYSPLPTPSSIRILDLYPGDSHEHIRCKLRYVDLELEEGNAYVGLSYCWGDPANPIVIEYDGQKTWVTQSLHSALRRIRDITSPATLWIDALCNSLWVEAFYINQSREPNGLRE